MLALFLLDRAQELLEVLSLGVFAEEDVRNFSRLVVLLVMHVDNSLPVSCLDVPRAQLQALVVVEARLVHLALPLVAHRQVVQKCLVDGLELGLLRLQLSLFFVGEAGFLLGEVAPAELGQHEGLLVARDRIGVALRFEGCVALLLR